MWTVGGRLGFLATPRVLLYGLAGYSRLSLKGTLDAHFDDPFYNKLNSYKDFKKDPSELGVAIDDDVSGWTVGGGVEAKLEKRLSLKLEYRYSHFDSASADTSNSKYGTGYKKDGSKYKVYERWIEDGAKLDLGDTDVHSVRAVLSFKFGGHEESVAPLK